MAAGHGFAANPAKRGLCCLFLIVAGSLQIRIGVDAVEQDNELVYDRTDALDRGARGAAASPATGDADIDDVIVVNEIKATSTATRRVRPA